MVRIAFFVDGSHLLRSLKALGLEVVDYQAFYAHLFHAAEQKWRARVGTDQRPTVVLQRVYWYAVGSIDPWNHADARVLSALRGRFEADEPLKASYMAQAQSQRGGSAHDDLMSQTWALWLEEARAWYQGRTEALQKMKHFHYAVQCATDFIDIMEIGTWKIDLLTRSCDERGIAARLAIDMLAMGPTYDVAVIVGGDVDSIAPMEAMKRQGKHVAAVELLTGNPQEPKWERFPSKVQLVADFVVRVYEMELLSAQLARKSRYPAG